MSTDCKISTFFGECANVMKILNLVKVGNKLFTKQSFFTFKDGVRRTIVPTLNFMIEMLNDGSTHLIRLTNFKRIFELCLSCDDHADFFKFLQMQFQIGEFKTLTLRWLFCLFDEVMSDCINFADHMAEELKDSQTSQLVRPAIALRLKELMDCLDLVASQENNRREILHKYGKQAMAMGGPAFKNFIDLYSEFCDERKVFGRISQEVSLRKNSYLPIIDSNLLEYLKKQNQLLLSEMKGGQQELQSLNAKGKGPAVEEMSDEEEDYSEEPSSKKSKLREEEESDISMGDAADS
jgi:hypothetical protein